MLDESKFRDFCDCLPGAWENIAESYLQYRLEPPSEQDSPVEIAFEGDTDTLSVQVHDSDRILLFSYSAPVSMWEVKQTVDDHNLLTMLQVQGRGVRQDILSIRGPYAKQTPEGIRLPDVDGEEEFLLDPV